jgi:hypothetical protein
MTEAHDGPQPDPPPFRADERDVGDAADPMAYDRHVPWSD